MEKPAANTQKCAETQEPGVFAMLLEVMPVNKAVSIPLWDELGLIHHPSGVLAMQNLHSGGYPPLLKVSPNLLLVNMDNNIFFILCHDRGVKQQLFRLNGQIVSHLLLQNRNWIVALPEDASAFLMEQLSGLGLQHPACFKIHLYFNYQVHTSPSDFLTS